MPRPRIEREVSNDGTTRVVEIETAAGGDEKNPDGSGKTVTAQYSFPATPEKFQEFHLAASDKPDGGAFYEYLYHRKAEHPEKLPSPLTMIYDLARAMVDKNLRAMSYEAVQATSTLISIGGGKTVDLMSFPVNRLVIAINGMRGKRSSDLMLLGIADPDAEEHATEVKSVDRKLNYRQFQTAASKLVDDGKAKENDASGMLELVA